MLPVLRNSTPSTFSLRQEKQPCQCSPLHSLPPLADPLSDMLVVTPFCMYRITDGTFGDAEYFQDLVDNVNDMTKSNDWFLVANDFASYMDAQKEVDQVSTVIVSQHQ